MDSLRPFCRAAIEREGHSDGLVAVTDPFGHDAVRALSAHDGTAVNIPSVCEAVVACRLGQRQLRVLLRCGDTDILVARYHRSDKVGDVQGYRLCLLAALRRLVADRHHLEGVCAESIWRTADVAVVIRQPYGCQRCLQSCRIAYRAVGHRYVYIGYCSSETLGLRLVAYVERHLGVDGYRYLVGSRTACRVGSRHGVGGLRRNGSRYAGSCGRVQSRGRCPGIGECTVAAATCGGKQRIAAGTHAGSRIGNVNGYILGRYYHIDRSRSLLAASATDGYRHRYRLLCVGLGIFRSGRHTLAYKLHSAAAWVTGRCEGHRRKVYHLIFTSAVAHRRVLVGDSADGRILRLGPSVGNRSRRCCVVAVVCYICRPGAATGATVALYISCCNRRSQRRSSCRTIVCCRECRSNHVCRVASPVLVVGCRSGNNRFGIVYRGESLVRSGRTAVAVCQHKAYHILVAVSV